MEIIQTTALISINETLWVQLLFFLLFLFVINRVMFRRVLRNMDERHQYIDGLTEDIHRLNQQMDELQDRVNREEGQMKREAMRLRDDLLLAGREESQNILEAAQGEVADLHRQAERKTRAALDEARRQVEVESKALAATILEYLLERRPVP